MIFTLIVQSAPYSTQAPETALRFARAALDAGHTIHRVFFYSDGVHVGSALASPPQDETNIPAEWRTLGEAHKLDMVVCIAAAVRRGVLNAHEAKRYSKPGHNLAEPFELSGLGQLVESMLVSDRTLTFGGAV